MFVYLRAYAWLGRYPRELNGERNIIVSLTSFPKRIDKVWMVVDSMFHQKLRPSAIHLYLTKEEFPSGESQLPRRLLRYKEIGLEIHFRDYNLMPHCKYFYALQEHSDKFVITVDDDMYYHHDLIENLWNLHCQFPNCVCANLATNIRISPAGTPLPYTKWENGYLHPFLPNHYSVALGYAGVLYPPNALAGSDAFNIDNIRSLSLRADDLWLKVHELLKGIKVVCGHHYTTGPSILGAQVISLMSSNMAGQNDEQMEKMWKHYKLNASMFLKD